MDAFEAIKKRHSYRGPYEQDTQIPRDDLRAIVEAGIRAPSGMNRQTTEFVIVHDDELVGKLRDMNDRNMAMQQATAYIACIVDKDISGSDKGMSFDVEDCAAAVENMLLAITALGYASVWVDGWLRGENHADQIAAMLGVPKTKTVRVILPIGKPAEKWLQKEKKPFEQRAWFNTYGE